MLPKPDSKALLKILIGAAWIDGRIQPEERAYLHRIADEYQLADDPEIKPLLNELVQIKPEQCYGWVRSYLGDRPTPEACQTLIEATSALVYSDGEIDVEEAKLLSRMQIMLDEHSQHEPMHKAVLKTIRNLYQTYLNQQT